MILIRLLIAFSLVYEVLLIIRILSSWIMPQPKGEMMRLLYSITDPYLNLFRRALPFLAMGGIDFSPIVGFLVLQFVVKILYQAL